MLRIVRPESPVTVTNCTVCRDTISVLKKDIGPQGVVFCSRECSRFYVIRGVKTENKRKRWKGFYRTEEWRALRRIVIKAQGRKCQACGVYCRGRNLHVDHIIPRSICPEKSLDLSNLQVLCKRCNEDKGARVVDYRKG